MHQIMRYTSKTHTLTQIMYTTDYFQGEITLNSMFVSFSIPTREHCRELKFIFCLRTEYIWHFIKVKYTTFLLLGPSDNENYFFV